VSGARAPVSSFVDSCACTANGLGGWSEGAGRIIRGFLRMHSKRAILVARRHWSHHSWIPRMHSKWARWMERGRRSHHSWIPAPQETECVCLWMASVVGLCTRINKTEMSETTGSHVGNAFMAICVVTAKGLNQQYVAFSAI